MMLMTSKIAGFLFILSCVNFEQLTINNPRFPIVTSVKWPASDALRRHFLYKLLILVSLFLLQISAFTF